MKRSREARPVASGVCSVGARLELIHPAGNRELQVERLVTPTGDEISRVPGSDHRVWLPLPPESVGAFVARFI